MKLIARKNKKFFNFFMKNYIQPNEKIMIAGGSGMAGNAIYRCLIKSGYGQQKFGGC